MEKIKSQDQISNILQLAKNNVPEFAEVQEDEFEVKKSSIAMTNDVYFVNSPNFSVVVKVFEGGRDDRILSRYEDKVQDFIRRSDIRPYSYYFKDGISIEERLPGKLLEAKDFHKKEMLTIAAKSLGKFLNGMSGIGPLNEVNMLQDYVDNGIYSYFIKSLEKLRIEYQNIEEGKEKDTLARIIAASEAHMEELTSPEGVKFLKEINRENWIFVFGHNDFFANNLMYDEANKEFNLIDFEFACYSPLGYDIIYLNAESLFQCGEAGNFKIDYTNLWDFETIEFFFKEHILNLDLTKFGYEQDDERASWEWMKPRVWEVYKFINFFVYFWDLFKIEEWNSLGFDLADYMECRLEFGRFLDGKING